MRQRDLGELVGIVADPQTPGLQSHPVCWDNIDKEQAAIPGIRSQSWCEAVLILQGWGKGKYDIALSLSIGFQTARTGKFHSNTANWKPPQSLCQFLSKSDFGNL